MKLYHEIDGKEIEVKPERLTPEHLKALGVDMDAETLLGRGRELCASERAPGGRIVAQPSIIGRRLALEPSTGPSAAKLRSRSDGVLQRLGDTDLH